jgi:hypothetical protein
MKEAADHLSAWGWAFMLISLTLVWSTTIWAYRRLLSAPREENTSEIG